MNPSSSVDTAAMLDVSELINRLTENYAEHERLKEEERERQEKAARRTAQDKAKSAAESLTTRMIKHTANIAAALSSGKKSVPVKLKSASGATLQAYSPSPSLCLPLSLPLSLSFHPSLFLSLSLLRTHVTLRRRLQCVRASSQLCRRTSLRPVMILPVSPKPRRPASLESASFPRPGT